MAESWADQYLRDANATARGRVSTIPAVTTSPDRQAEYDKLAKRFYVPPSVVENDPERFQRRAAVEDAQAHIDTAPKLGQWLGGDPQRAKMTHDSLDAMAGVEHMIDMTFGALRSTASRLPVAQPFPTNGTDADKLRYWREHNPGQGSITTPPTTAQVILAKLKNTTSTLYAGAQGLESTLSYAGAMAFSNVLGEQSTLYKTAMGHAIEAKSKQQQTSRSSFGGPWERALYQGVESLPTAGFAIGAGLLTGGWADSVLAGSVVGASAGGLAQAGSNYGEARQAGLTHEQATDYAMRGFLEETGTELLPISHTLKALQFNSPLGKRVRELAIGQLEEQFGEQAASHIEDFDKWATIEANQGKSFADYLAERPDVAFQTAVATAVGSLAIGGVATVKHALDTAKAKTQRKEQQAQRSQRTEALLTGLKELAEAAPIAKRDVSTFENWVKAAAEGTQATDVYIDARTLVETLQQSGLTEPEIVAALPSIRTELPTALLANGDVRIPIEEFAARSGELGQSLIPHLRIDPNDMSTSEAQTFMQSAQDDFQKETEKAFAEINADDQFRQSTERVADAVYEKLNQAGRFTPDTNRAYASLHAAFFARLASDLGTTPEEAAARYPLLIQSEGVGEGPGVMDQPQEADEAAAPQVFDQGERAPPALYPAIRHNGKIYKSVSDHLSALSQIPDPAERAKASADGDNRVYVTERGKVLDRFRAQEYAQAHDLISPDAPSWARTSPDLISENLRKPGRYYADTPREGYDQSGRSLPATIEVDGKQRSTVNSNGQPLAQTEEGVRAFWEWFGDSKVVDEQGRPLVVYHGTAADFDIFKNSPSTRHGHGRQMPGIYLTPDPSIAEAYARTAANARDASTEINGAAILPLFVKMENPARFADPEDFANANVVEIKKHGYDGAVRFAPNDGRLLEIVVFDPTQVKSIHNRGTFDPNDPRILYQNGQPVFYSALQRTVESSKQAKAPASQWKSILQNAPGVKAEELEWSGILDLFDEDPKRVWTRDELVQLLDAGGIKVDEVVLGGEPKGWEDLGWSVEYNDEEDTWTLLSPDGGEEGSYRFHEDAVRVARDYASEAYDTGTNFRDWSSDPNSDTYRELLITLPIGEGRNPDRAPSTHWDQPNVVAHARFMDKRDASGDRVLFIEEVQSDWHQKGRDQGYEQKVDPAAIEAAQKKYEDAQAAFLAAAARFERVILDAGRGLPGNTGAEDIYAAERLATTPVVGLEQIEGATEADQALASARSAMHLAGRERDIAKGLITNGGVPNAPFKASWPALVMKRMIRWAVDNGYTKIAWTTGEEQADRYNLSSVVEGIDATLLPDGRYRVNPLKRAAAQAIIANGMAEEGSDSVPIMTSEQMRQAFGENISAQLVAGAQTEGEPFRLEGVENLRVGGEGMKAFYDRNLVNITNDLIKKHGVKVGKISFTPEDPLAQVPFQGDTRGDNHGFEINDKLAEAAAGGFPLFQGPRGQIRIGDVTQDPTVITLLQRADLSTFLHESGHFFLEVLMHVAAQPDAPQRVVDDVNAFLKWTGVESMGQWSKMTTNEKRPHHERFARGVEAFLYEGNAPSLELKSLFQRFRGWLLTVYRSLTQLNVELTPEMRGVFNRMLASDQAIREAEQQVGYEPILTEKPEGMTGEEWEAYQRLGADATSEAVTDLERRSLRDMRYAGKAAGRELKRLQREIRTMREAMRTEVEADMAREPVYRAQEFMKKGLLDGEPVEGPTKMLISEVEALYEDRPKLYVDEVKRALGFGQYGMLAKDGIHPEQIAELFGFTSADHMIQDLMLAEPFKQAVETEIDTRMLERYGDLTSEKALQDAVDQAIHNDVRGRFVATEFAALSKAPGKPRVMAAAARSLAEKAVSRLKVRNLRPAQYEAAERRAAKAAAEASAKGDIPLAASEKRNQLINFYSAKASHDALADVDKMVLYFKKFENKGTRQNLDVGYLDQIDKLLERFDLRKSVTNKQIDRRKSLDAWIKQQQEMGFEPVISAELADEASRVHYREMTVEEMRGLRDAIKNIEYLARLKKRLLLAKDKREFDATKQEVAESIRANAYKTVEIPFGEENWWEKVTDGGDDIFAMHRKMANLAYVMDGNKMGGPMWEHFIRFANERGAWEASAKAKATRDLAAIFDLLKHDNVNKRTYVPEIGRSLSLQDRLMVALNMGNEGNLQRLHDGDRFTDAQLAAIVTPLQQHHIDFVEAIWRYLDSWFPEIAAKTVRVTGVAPEKVEAQPVTFTTADGKPRPTEGGYFPIKYDPRRHGKTAAQLRTEQLDQMRSGAFVASQTRHGFIKTRQEQVDRPVRKDFGVIFSHVNQVIYDLAWHEYLIDVNRLLRATEIDSAVREHYGPNTIKWMAKALEDIAIGEMPARDRLEAAANSLRVGASVSTMAWNFLTALQQPLGLVSAAGRIGPRWVLKGIKNILGDAVHMENTARWVYERSEVMRNRATTQQREIAEVRNKVSDKSPLRKAIAKTLSIAPGVEGDAVIDAVQNSYFFFITKAQLIADLPTWVGQYEKSMAAGETEDRAAALADQAVLDTQGGGQIKDMAGVQRGPVYLKLFTNFYSFFNATLNMNADRIAQLRREGITDIPAFAADMLLINVLPSVLGTLIYTLLLGDDDDRDIEGFIKKAGGDLIGYMMSQIVGLREFSGLATGGDTTYAGPAGTRFFKETTNLANQVRQGEADEAAFRAANKTAGILFKYPSTAVDRFVRGSAALEQGEAGPLAPVVGPPVDR